MLQNRHIYKNWEASYLDFFIKINGPFYWLPYDKWGYGIEYFFTSYFRI